MMRTYSAPCSFPGMKWRSNLLLCCHHLRQKTTATTAMMPCEALHRLES